MKTIFYKLFLKSVSFIFKNNITNISDNKSLIFFSKKNIEKKKLAKVNKLFLKQPDSKSLNSTNNLIGKEIKRDGFTFYKNNLKLKESWNLIYFGFINCPDVCPIALRNLNKVKNYFDLQGVNVEIIFISLDPERDTQDKIDEYCNYFNQNFNGFNLKTELNSFKKQFGVGSKIVKTDSTSNINYTIDHSSDTYILNSQGIIKYVIRYDTLMNFPTDFPKLQNDTINDDEPLLKNIIFKYVVVIIVILTCVIGLHFYKNIKTHRIKNKSNLLL